MVAILTGDIINSTEHNASKWLPVLKEALGQYGNEPLTWEIYRGDSFQLETTPEQALEASIYLKACIKQLRSLDVRIAIGLGEKTYSSEKITESNGGAFVNSGKCFEALKKQNLGIKSPDQTFDGHMNLLLELALLTMDHWTPAISKTVKTAIENPKMNQRQLASVLNKSQGNISEELNRAGFDEIQKMVLFYRTQLVQL
ncbi:transcriptional regulator [Flagellimonas nanhaiensis]|uniref:Transcriptional regulator n=1 Tax=Flagellimonas nanhaiensis TaxID=2292706 RepID=A0A371JP38_9FLAO|nr:transcriptional regulator [Allomuricauda nanhaiensis]RDY59251.1 transcriptional regulator [Allomuricauda nanhaiensis]